MGDGRLAVPPAPAEPRNGGSSREQDEYLQAADFADWPPDSAEVWLDQVQTGYREPGQGRLTLILAVTAAVSAFGSSFPHGWNTGVMNAPSRMIRAFLNESYTQRSGYPAGEKRLDLLFATSVSIYLVGGCGGALAAGWLADKFGRRNALLVCHAFGFLAAIFFGFCQMAMSLEMLILARIVVGFSCGAGSGLVPMYLTEISPVNIRGAMGVLHQFALTCGILVSQVIGMREILGSQTTWPYLLALTAFPCLVSAVVLPWFPDSPRYLLVKKKDEKAAEAALQRFRGEEDVELDIQEMNMEVEQQKNVPNWTLKQLLAARGLRMPLLLVCALGMCQQLSGINVVFYYSSEVFEDAGIPKDKTQFAVIGTGVVNVLMTGISVPLMEKSGRRPLLLGGMFGMVVSAVVITIALNLKDTVPEMAYVSIVCIISFVISFAVGLGSIPQFIGAELFKQGPRPLAMSISGFLNWLCNFLVAISYPSMEGAMGAYSFIVFIVLLVVFGLFLWWKLPETKNLTYEEIARMFQVEGVEDTTSPQPEAATLIRSATAPNGQVGESPSNHTELSYISNSERLQRRLVN